MRRVSECEPSLGVGNVLMGTRRHGENDGCYTSAKGSDDRGDNGG